jgi:hypothetical protein
MKLFMVLSALTAMALPIASPGQGVAGTGGAASRQEPTEDLRMQNALSQAEIRRLAEQIDQWHRVDGTAGVPPNVARTRTSAMLAVLKVSCAVSDAAYRGQTLDDTGTQIYEAACEKGGGYVIRSPRPGSIGKLEALSCQEAFAQGVPCELSPQPQPTARPEPAADARPALAWFKDALAGNGVLCETRRARIVGRESIKRRYVVEFECVNRAEGLIAFVPAAGDSVNPFESMSCVSAAARGIRCELLSGPQE